MQSALTAKISSSEPTDKNGKRLFNRETDASKRRQRILVLGQLFYPELISNGQGLTELAEALVDSGVEVEAVCGLPTIVDRKKKIPAVIYHGGIKIRRVRGTRLPKLSLCGKVANQLSFAVSAFFHLLFQPAKKLILVDTTPAYLPFFCALLRILKGTPYVIRLSDVYPDTAVNFGIIKKGGWIEKIWDRINLFSFRHAAVVIVLGRCMRDLVDRRTGGRFAGKIRMIPLWCDDALICPLPAPENKFRRQWGLEGKFVVSYSGNMGRFHDMETIMEAARVLSGNQNVVFLFTGEGHKKKWMRDFAGKQGLTNCQFHSYVAKEDLRDLLTCADVGLVSLAKGQEGLSVPSKTYGIMAAGVPAIAIMSSASEIARVIREEGCGAVVEPGDVRGLVEATLDLFNDRNKLETMGKNARRAVDNKYNLQSAARAFYESISCLYDNMR